MSWKKYTKKNGPKVDDRVRYTKGFLVSTGQQVGDAGFARGIVDEVKSFGSMTLAVIDWGEENPQPKKVNALNLEYQRE